MLISIVTPFYNEAAGIEAYFARLESALAAITDHRFEFVCVDDGSTDSTLQQLMDRAAVDPRVRVVELSRNFGKEAALSAGLVVARGDAVVPLDADLQDPPEVLPEMLAAWDGGRGADVVLAHRSDRSTDTRLKRTSASAFYRIFNRISALRLPDDVGDFRLMDRLVVDRLNELPENQRFMKGLFAWVGFRTTTVEYRRPERAAGGSKFGARGLLRLAVDGITSFSAFPLRIWFWIGTLGAFASAVYTIVILYLQLTGNVDVPGYASLLVAVLFFGSLNLLSIGIVGEYVGRVFSESKRRPAYIIRKVYGDSDGA